jgi:hypothetical protein
MAKKILFGLMLVALFASCVREPVEADRQFIVEVGDMIPAEFFNMEMELFGSEETVDFSELKGKVVMIQFATYHCNMTRDKMRQIEPRIWQEHKDNDDFRLFGIVRGEPDRNTPANIQSLINTTGVTYPVGLDLEREIFTLFARPDGGATRDILIDRSGEIVMLTRYFGRDNMVEFNALVAKIDQLLAD